MTRRTPAEYQDKAAAFEGFLSDLNAALIPAFGAPASPSHPNRTVQIVGLPRSGTTILYQLLASSRAVGYVSNVMAMFWEVPVVGATIQRGLARPQPTMSTRSIAGRTPEPLDPHEFGYFWRAALGHSANSVVRDLEPWSAERLQTTLDAVTEVFEAPVVYKNFLVLAHVWEMRRDLRRMQFLLPTRPVEEVAASLVLLRRSLGDSAPAAIGLQPAPTVDGEPLSGVAAVVHQVRALDRMQQEGEFLTSPDSMDVPYSELCKAPREVVEEILRFTGAPRGVARLDELPDRLDPGHSLNNLSTSERRELDRAFAQDESENHA